MEQKVEGVSNSLRLRSVDVLRGIAVSVVVLAHVPRDPPRNDLILPYYLVQLPIEFGYLGVHLFLVLSGFCIHLSVAHSYVPAVGFAPDWKSFWYRRFWRLYPPYLAAIVLGLATYYGTGAHFVRPWERIHSIPQDLFLHFCMLHSLFVNYANGVGNTPLWTMGLEEQLYGLYFFYLLARRKLSATAVALISLAVVVTWRALSLVVISSEAAPVFSVLSLGNFPMNWWFLWVLGAVAAEAYVGVIRLPQWSYRPAVGLLAGAIGMVLSDRVLSRFVGSNWMIRAYGDWSGAAKLLIALSDLAVAIAFFVLLNLSVRKESGGTRLSLRTRLLSGVGLVSYSIYLIHLPVIRVLEYLLQWDKSPLFTALRYPVYFFGVLAVGLVFFRFVERPFLSLSRARSARVARLHRYSPGQASA